MLMTVALYEQTLISENSGEGMQEFAQLVLLLM